MTIQTKARMKLEHFHDFYFLQALQEGIRTAVAANPEKAFSKAVEKLTEDVSDFIAELFPNLALRSFVYLYAACLGEARHSRESIAESLWIPETQSMHRAGLYRVATDYRPNKNNLDVLVKVFDQPWSSGFGGKAWKNIADSLVMYFSHPPAAFIDHIIDLEHNGGCVFNKTDARDTLHFEAEYEGNFKMFLDYKFRYDILAQEPDGIYGNLLVTRKTRKLLTRYEIIFNKKPITWVTGGLETLDDYLVEWGNEEFHLEEKWSKGADVSNGNFPKSGDLFSLSGLENLEVTDMTEKEILTASKKAKTKMLKTAGKYLDSKIKLGIESKIKRWVQHATKYAKQPKKSTTYQALPVTVKPGQGNVSLLLEVQVPYDGYGQKTETGFCFETKYFFISNKIFEGGVEGHLEAQNGHIVLYAKNNMWYMIDKKLEAFFD
jgi:hypothetical protein